MSTRRVCVGCLVLTMFASFISCTTSTRAFSGNSKVPLTSPDLLRPTASDTPSNLNSVSLTWSYGSSMLSSNEHSEDASSFLTTRMTTTSTLTESSVIEEPHAVSQRQFSQRVSRCLSTQSKLVLSVVTMRLDSADWNINRSTAASLTCTLTLSAQEDKILRLTYWGNSASMGDCSEQNYITLTDAGSSHSVKISDCADNFNRFASRTNTLTIVINVGETRMPWDMTVIVEAVETALETGEVSDTTGNC